MLLNFCGITYWIIAVLPAKFLRTTHVTAVKAGGNAMINA